MWKRKLLAVLAALLALSPLGLPGQVKAVDPVTYSGTVTDQNGNPLPDIGVWLVRTDGIPSTYTGGTDGGGAYSISVPPTTYTFELSGYIQTVPQPVTVTADTVQNITIPLVELTIHVVDPDGNPILMPLLTGRVTQNPNPLITLPSGHLAGANTHTVQMGGDGILQLNVYPGVPVTNLQISQAAGYNTQNIANLGTFSQNTTLTVQLQHPPATPQNLAAPSPAKTASLSWDAVANVTHYQVSRNGTIFTTAATSYIDNISSGSYSYTIAACNQAGCSTPSSSITVVVDNQPPALGTPTWSVNPLATGTTTTFSVDASDNVVGVAAGEYFIDSDPGEGGGIPLNWDGSTFTSSAFGSGVSPGVHTIGIRARDNLGTWSAPVYDFLVVYDPAGPTDVVGKKDVVPSLANGDVLPGLTSPTQTDEAVFGFDVFFGTGGLADPASEFTFCYDLSGKRCKKAQENPFALTATTFSLLNIAGANSSQAVFQAEADMTENGETSSVLIRVEVTDGNRLTPSTADHINLKIYPLGSDPLTTNPTYQISADVSGGGNDLKIQ